METASSIARAMQSFVIEGGRPLSGTVRASGNKNGALPILAACVLASDEVRLENVPRIRDVETMIELLADIGADVEWTGPNEVRVDPGGVVKSDLDADLAREIRASFLLAGPLLARFGRVTVPPPGGDVIGRRRLDTHIHAFQELGVEVTLNGAYEMRTDGLRGKQRLFLDEASVMGTENAIMAAVLADGRTCVVNAACEPHIQDLCRFLVSLGARIDGIGSNMLHIEGVEELHGGEHRIGPEHVEVASFAALAAVTGGEVTIEDVEPDDLISIVPAFRKLGIRMDVTDRTLHVAASKSGSTLETRSHLAWAWERHPDPARFAVITDPGSDLAALAADRGFAATFENRPDIGGRYSALSYFGLVPAVLAGADVAGLLASAAAMADRLRAAAPGNAAARLAAAMAAGVRQGRDKLTLVAPDDQATFGLWLEQLLAESTGKDGTGVVPVVGEPLTGPEAYGDDRLFVALGDSTATAELAALADAGHPVVVLPFGGEFVDLGAQVLLWELATALVGALLDIQPFDQPDVAAAKAATARVLDEGPPAVELTPLDELLGQVRAGDYLAIQAFVDPGSPVVDDIERARVALRDRLEVATTVGLGPRFLHSTGQLHKGGPNTGVFVQVVADHADDADVAIPGAPYGFATLERAQADGDLLTLHDRKRRAGRVRLADLVEVSP